MNASSSNRAALADLCVYAMGHEIAAIKLCGHAAAQCSDQVGRMLLVDLALERIDELNRLQLAADGLAVSAPHLEDEDVRRLLRLKGQRRAAPRPSLRRLRLTSELIGAIREFDQQALVLLRSMGRLVPPSSGTEVIEQLEDSKVRWIALCAEIGRHLAGELARGDDAGGPLDGTDNEPRLAAPAEAVMQARGTGGARNAMDG